MKVLVIGSGGREHALAWKLAQSERVQCVYVAPGNGGTAQPMGAGGGGGRAVAPICNLPLSGNEALAAFAHTEGVALTVVGPETPLAAGVVDHFRARGLRIFGPTQAAARLESSKDFAKSFMQRHGVPTAAYATFTDAAAAHAHVDQQGVPIVIKADGLAAGKGVVVATTVAQAHAAIDDMLGDNALGVKHNVEGARVVIEAFMADEEASFIVLCDGRRAVALATSQDHKRLGEGDNGPNTGGMGAYSPAPVVTPNVHARVMHEIIQPTLAGMAQEGHPFTGFLYAGLMIGPDGRARTVEFNCRLGDPEAQVILPRLKSDLYEVLMAATSEAGLGELELQWDRRVALGVVMAAAGYPQLPKLGDTIHGADDGAQADVHLFHAGTTREEDRLRTSGGRVLCVTALADSVRQAQARALAAVRQVHFEGAQWRNDIGHRALRP